MTIDLEHIERLALDIDLRLAFVWIEALDGTELDRLIGGDGQLRAEFGALVRAAYGRGYIDALREDREDRRAELHRTHGYRPE